MRSFILAALALTLPLSGCLASKIVTVPVSLAGDALEATGKGVMYVGGTAVRVTGDALDGRDEMVRLQMTYETRGRTQTEIREVKAKHVEREIKQMNKKGRVVDVLVAPAD